MTSERISVSLADRLPDRPLQPGEVGDLGEELEWSFQRIGQETGSGTEFVAVWYAFAPADEVDVVEMDSEGDALAFDWDSESGKWSGRLVRGSVTLSEWLEISERAAKTLGYDLSAEEVDFDEDGDPRRFGDRD